VRWKHTGDSRLHLWTYETSIAMNINTSKSNDQSCSSGSCFHLPYSATWGRLSVLVRTSPQDRLKSGRVSERVAVNYEHHTQFDKFNAIYVSGLIKATK
jgi:hypothetical protein